MAGYRQFHTKFWKDDWTIDLDPLERYLFIYLFSNDLSSISGIYRLPLKVITNETGLELDFVISALDKFERSQKILYRDNTVWVVNMDKYHSNASEKTQKRVRADIDTIPDNIVKQAYICHKTTGIFCIDTVSIGYAYQSLKAKDKAKDKTKAKSENEDENEANEISAAASQTFSSDPADRIWRIIKPGSLVIPPTLRESTIPVIDLALRRNGGDEQKTAVEGKTYFDAWCGRRGKDGKFYSPSGRGWIDWWAQGEIPSPHDGNSGQGFVPTEYIT